MQNDLVSELKTALVEINDLRSARSLLHWDQATYMPPGGASARARQSATLVRIAHEKFTSPRIGEMLDALERSDLGDEDGDDASLVRIARRNYDYERCISTDWKSRFAIHGAGSYVNWTRARPANDFAAVRPFMEKTLDMSRELASFFPHEHPADPLILNGGRNREVSDEGSVVATLRPLFASLRDELVPLVEEVCARPPADRSCMEGHFPEAGQSDFTRPILSAIGFDWTRGRLDKTHHPFMTKFSIGDVRITNRCNETRPLSYFFGALHEAGHGLYEQGIAPELEGTPLAGGTSSGMHESQSRLWENLVGRSHAFWEYAYPQLGAIFPQFGSVPLETFWRAINRVERTPLRVAADELTYNLHVIIRFELELQMLEGALEIRDLPEAWREAYRRDLGVVPENDQNGCLQDVHWFSGIIGGRFQGYTLGNILSAQFFAKAVEAVPAIPDQIARGEFDDLRGWLTQNIYRHGSKYATADIIQRAAGEPLNIKPYISYLRRKYTKELTD